MAMKYDFDIRAVAFEDQTIEEKHNAFLSRLEGLQSPWGPIEAVPAPDCGTYTIAMINWTKMFGTKKGIGGHILYKFRSEFTDIAFYDDKIMLSFNPAKIDYRGLIDVAMPRYVAAFDGYYAEMTDQEFLHMDKGKRQKGFDPRHHLHRLPPVSYMRRDFCARALGLTPEQVVGRLEGKIAVVREMLDGVVTVLTYDILPTEEMDRLCWEAKARLIG